MFCYLQKFVIEQNHNSTDSSAEHLQNFVHVVVKYPEGGEIIDI